MKFVIMLSCFVQQQYLWNIIIKPNVVCYNIWANRCCSGCSLLRIKLFWNKTIGRWVEEKQMQNIFIQSYLFHQLHLKYSFLQNILLWINKKHATFKHWCGKNGYLLNEFWHWGRLCINWNTTNKLLLIIIRYLQKYSGNSFLIFKPDNLINLKNLQIMCIIL